MKINVLFWNFNDLIFPYYNRNFQVQVLFILLIFLNGKLNLFYLIKENLFLEFYKNV